MGSSIREPPRWTTLLSAGERDEAGEDEGPRPHLVGVQPRAAQDLQADARVDEVGDARP